MKHSLYSVKFAFGIILIVLLSTVTLPAQEIVTVSVFSVIPSGAFAATDTKHGGFAQPGFGAGLEYSVILPLAFSARTSVLYCVNSFNGNEYKKLINYNGYDEYTTETGYYHSLWVLTGPEFRLPGRNAGINVQGGVVKSSYPEVRFFTDTEPQTGRKNSGFSPAFGATIFYETNRIEAGVRYLYARPEFVSEFDFLLTGTREKFVRTLSAFLLYAAITF